MKFQGVQKSVPDFWATLYIPHPICCHQNRPILTPIHDVFDSSVNIAYFNFNLDIAVTSTWY